MKRRNRRSKKRRSDGRRRAGQIRTVSRLPELLEYRFLLSSVPLHAGLSGSAGDAAAGQFSVHEVGTNSVAHDGATDAEFVARLRDLGIAAEVISPELLGAVQGQVFYLDLDGADARA